MTSAMNGGGVSAIVLTGDEEAQIGDCLRHLSWANEVLVVDSGSTDATRDIAAGSGARIVQQAWQGFAAQRNFGAAQAAHDWVLFVDADERITSELAAEIPAVLRSPKYAGYHIPMRNSMFGRWMRYGGLGRQYHLRLYNRTRGRWVRDVHEVVELDGPAGSLHAAMEHYAYRTIRELLEKVDRYTDAEARALRDRGARPTPGIILRDCLGLFLYKYFWQRGCLDGYPGLLWAGSLSYYNLLKWMKLWELSRS